MPAPQRLGKYEIRRKLGAGAMGIVYEGFDPLIERSVALKVIREDDFGTSEVDELRARLRREAQAAGRLAHPGIVAVYEYGEDSAGGAFIAMEMVRGRELRELLEGGHRFPAEQTVGVMRAVLAALQHAHERGVVHRDIKPSNVFIQDDGQIKVADFGVARLETSDLTQAGAMIGTPSYMSPEQLLGQAVDGRSDLFSCGVMLYQLLTGEKPFTGSVTTVMHKVLHEQAVPPSMIDPGLIPRWDAVIRRALAKQPADRYQSADEFARAIAVALDEMPRDDATVAMPPVRVTPAPSPTSQTSGTRRSQTTVTTPSAPRPAAPATRAAAAAPRVSTPAIAAAVATLVAAAGGMAWWLTRDDAGDATSTMAALPPPTPTSPSATVSAATPAPAPVEAAPPPSQPSPAPPAPAELELARPASAALAPPARAPAPPATPAPKPADPWQVQRSRVETARAPQTTGQAMRLLLDVKGADERDLLADFDRMLADLPAHSALAFGVRDGQLRWRTQSKAADGAAAARLALQRCNDKLPAPCRVVWRDGEFGTSAFLEATSTLGALDVATVRSLALRAVAGELKTWREQLAAATPGAPAPPAPAPKPTAAPVPPYGTVPTPAPAPAAPAPAPVVRASTAPPSQPSAASAPLPSTPPGTGSAPAPVVAAATPRPPAAEAPAPSVGDWQRAQSALRASPGPSSLADALIVMLGAQTEADVEALRRFGSAMKRLRWISALAMGESRNGVIAYGYSSNQPKESWAQERALQECARATNSPCAVVFVNGDARNTELAALAGKLASRSQASVRHAFIESTKQTLARGTGL